MDNENTFIPDEELDLLEKEDLLGTKPYAGVLYEIIKNCTTPFNIGLLGGWGSGKSTIVRTLKSKLGQDENIGCFVYDAWKYSQDSFRRTFILQLKDRFDLNISDEEWQEFYADKNEQLESRVGTLDGWWKTSFILLIPLLIYFAISYFSSRTIGFTEFVSSILFVAIMAFLSKVFVTYSVDFTKPKIFASEEFEEKFEETLQGIFKKKDLDKLLIVVDNIDRCHNELVIELLLTIKNFLGKDKTVFLLPIDEDGVKNFLEDTNQDENEFLRKILNTNLKLKKFSNNELFDFSKKICEEYGLYDLGINDSIVNIASKEYARNPRKLIQFFNNLQSEIRIANLQEKNGQIPEKSVTENLEFLAKIVIIRHEWADLYQKIFDKPWLLKQITKNINEDNYTKEDGDNIVFDKIGIPELTENQFRFFSRTKGISVDDVEPFLVNKDVFQDIPDEIGDLVESTDWEEIKNHLQEDNLNFERLVEIINDKFDVEVTKRGLYPTTGLWLFSLTLKIITDENYQAEFKRYQSVGKFQFLNDLINEDRFKEHLLQLNFPSLVKASKWFYDEGNDLFASTIIDLCDLDSKEFTSSSKSQLLKVFINEFRQQNEYIKKIRTPFSSFLDKEPSEIKEFKDTLRDVELADFLLTHNLRMNFADNIINDINDERNVLYINILGRLTRKGKNKNVIDEKLNEKYFKYLNTLNNNNNWDSIGFWVSELSNLVPCFSNISTKENILTGTTNYLRDQYQSNNTGKKQLRIYESHLILLKKCYTSNNGYRNQALADINSFFKFDSSSQITTFIAQIYRELLEHFTVWPPTGQVINKIDRLGQNDKEEIYDLCDLMISKSSSGEGLNKAQKRKIINNYIQEVLKHKDDVFTNKIFFRFKSILKGSWRNRQIIRDCLDSLTKKSDIEYFIKKAHLFNDNSVVKNLPHNYLKVIENPRKLENTLDIIEANITKDKIINDALIKNYRERKNNDGSGYFEIASLVFKRNKKGRKNDVNEIVNDFRPILKSNNENKISEALGLLTLLGEDDLYKNRKEWLVPLLKEVEIKKPGDKKILESVIEELG